MEVHWGRWSRWGCFFSWSATEGRRLIWGEVHRFDRLVECLGICFDWINARRRRFSGLNCWCPLRIDFRFLRIGRSWWLLSLWWLPIWWFWWLWTLFLPLVDWQRYILPVQVLPCCRLHCWFAINIRCSSELRPLTHRPSVYSSGNCTWISHFWSILLLRCGLLLLRFRSAPKITFRWNDWKSLEFLPCSDSSPFLALLLWPDLSNSQSLPFEISIVLCFCMNLECSTQTCCCRSLDSCQLWHCFKSFLCSSVRLN